MDIREYLFRHKIKKYVFAKKIKASGSGLHAYLERTVSPSLEKAILIHQVTNGEVGYEDMVAIKPLKHRGPRRKARETSKFLKTNSSQVKES